MARPYKVTVWGANGYVGRLVCEHMAKNYQGVKWAMAGRNQAKVEAARAELAKEAPAADGVPIVLADTQDAESVARMVRDTDVLLTVVGPYAQHGKEVLQACVEAGTHYCDLTGEAQFVRHSIEAHHADAQASGARIVHCCGFDSVPSDMTALLAAHHLRTKHGAAVEDSEGLLLGSFGGVSGGTIASFLGVLREPRETQRKIATPYVFDPRNWDKPPRELRDHHDLELLPHRARVAGGAWTAPFVMAPVNAPIVRRSNFFHEYGPTFSYSERTKAGNVFVAALVGFGTALAGLLLALAARVKIVERLLPVAGSGPSRERCEKGYWEFGNWSRGRDSSGAMQIAEARLKDPCRDPGYLSTSRMILEAALAMALQQDELQSDPYAGKVTGGVLTPASALGLVYVERLKKSGIEVIVRNAAGRGDAKKAS